MRIIAIPFGKSRLGAPITGFQTENASPKVLVMSGLHGDEVEGIIHCTQIASALLEEKSPLLEKLLFLPIANPDGNFLNQRWTSSNIDLNRNFPTADWTPKFENPRYPPGPSAASEPETGILMSVVKNHGISLVLDLHSYKETVLLPLFCKNAGFLDQPLNAYSESAKIQIVNEQADLGYTIAGGFHTWCYESGVHNLTVEIEKGVGQYAIKEKYLAGSLEFLRAVAELL